MTNEERISEVHKRVNAIDKSVSKIYGGVAVGAFVILLIGGILTHHVNFRFSNIEKTLEKIEAKVTANSCLKENKITQALPYRGKRYLND